MSIQPKKKTVSFDKMRYFRTDSGKKSQLPPHEKAMYLHRSKLEKQIDDKNSKLLHEQAKQNANFARKEGYSLPPNSNVKDLTQFFDPDYSGIDSEGIRYEPVQDEKVNRNTYYNEKNRRPKLTRQEGVRNLGPSLGGIRKSNKSKKFGKFKKSNKFSKSKKSSKSKKI
jgi:hypothetical protein